MNIDESIRPAPDGGVPAVPTPAAPPVSCPACRKPLLIRAASAGQHVRCPHCQHVFMYPPPAPVAEAVPVEEELDFQAQEPPPESAALTHDWQDWRVPRQGLNLVYFGSMSYAVAPIAYLALIALKIPVESKLLIWSAAALPAGGLLAVTAGLWLCARVSVPRLFGWGLGASMCGALAYLLLVGGYGLLRWGIDPGMDPGRLRWIAAALLIGFVAGAALALAASLCFQIYLLGIADYFGDRRLRDRLGTWLIVALVLTCASFASAAWLIERQKWLAMLLLGDAVFSLLLLIWWLALVGGVTRCIDRATKQTRPVDTDRPSFDAVGVGPGWSSVRSGLTAIVLGAVPIALAVAYRICVRYLPLAIPGKTPVEVLEWIAVVLWCGAGLGFLVLLAGVLLCGRVPAETRLRPFVGLVVLGSLSSIGLISLGGAVDFGWGVWPVLFHWPRHDGLLALTLVGLACAAFAKFFFVWFLRDSALFFQSKFLAQGLVHYLIGFFLISFAAFFATVFAPMVTPLMAVVPIALYVWLMSSLRHVQKMIDARQRQTVVAPVASSQT